MKNGKLIVIEGGDSAGKATQTKLLKERLEASGLVVAEMDFPRYEENQVGALIRECLDGRHGDFLSTDPRIGSLFYAADRRESLPQITSWLEAGKIVIMDRYGSASLLHQGAKVSDPEKRKAILEWIYKLEYDIMGLPKPDLLIFLNVPASMRIALLRQQLEEQGRELDLAEKNQTHQEQVDEAKSDMLSMFEHSVEVQCTEKDTLLSREAIADIIEEKVRAILPL